MYSLLSAIFLYLKKKVWFTGWKSDAGKMIKNVLLSYKKCEYDSGTLMVDGSHRTAVTDQSLVSPLAETPSFLSLLLSTCMHPYMHAFHFSLSFFSLPFESPQTDVSWPSQATSWFIQTDRWRGRITVPVWTGHSSTFDFKPRTTCEVSSRFSLSHR